EVNDTLATATDLGRLNSTTQTGLTIHSPSDVDFFRITARNSGTFQVAITFVNATGNLDLMVYDSAGRLLGSSTSLASRESVAVNLSQSQPYYVKVFSPNGGVNNYDLSITKVGGGARALDGTRDGTHGPGDAGATSGLRLSPEVAEAGQGRELAPATGEAATGGGLAPPPGRPTGLARVGDGPAAVGLRPVRLLDEFRLWPGQGPVVSRQAAGAG